jgi:nitrogen fixation/metabolism regulation signal transduction histidine kinase
MWAMKPTLSLTNKYILLSFVILLYILGLVFSSFVLTEKIKGESQKINLASQQHMQLLRISSLMHFFVNPSPLAIGISETDSTRKIMVEAQRYETVLYGLKSGNEDLGLHPVSSDDRQSLAQLELLLNLWTETQKPLLQTITSSPEAMRQDFCTSCHSAFRDQIGQVNVLAANISIFYNENLDSFKKFRFFALLLFPVLLITMTWFIRLKLILPIRKLIEANDRIEMGDFETRLPVLSEDEIGSLTRSHNHMSQTLKQLFIENEDHLSQLTFVNREMQASMDNLADEKIFTESIISSLDSGLMVIDLEGMILTANPSGVEILNLFDPDPVGRSLVAVLGEKPFKAMTTISSKESHTSGEISIPSLKGDKRALEFTATNRKDVSGKKLGLIVSFRDVTDENYLHKEMEKMDRLRTVAEIATAVAHEVRNPLAGISTMAQAIDENLKENDDNKEYIRRIIRQINRLNKLLTEFFTYARPNDPRKVTASIREIINETKHLIDNRLYKMGIELKERYEDDLPFIKVDPNQIQQVFLNLMLNSVEAFTGSGTIEIIAERVDEKRKGAYMLSYPELRMDSDYLVVHFRDTGPGLAGDVADKIFEPFVTTKHNGSGMGLSIVYRILKDNDATIHLDDSVNEGVGYIIFLRVSGP